MTKSCEEMPDGMRHRVAARFKDRASGSTRQCLDREPGPQQLQSMILMVTGSLPRQSPGEMTRKQLEEIAGHFKRAIARERGRARSGHRSYNANRHIALYQALRGLQRLIDNR